MTKASDNIFPKVTFVEGSAPASPSANDFHLYFDSADHLLKWKDSAGSVTTVSTGGASITTFENRLAGDVSITASTFADGPSLSLNAGTYVIDGYIEVEAVGGSNTWITARLMSGATAIDGRSSFCETNTADESLYLGAVLVLSGTTTVKIQATTLTNAGVIRASAPQNGTGLTNLACYLRAMKIA